MAIKDFKEKDIRAKIINKINPEIKKGRSKHDKGKVIVDGKLAARVKLPNDHCRVMKKSKSKYIASDLGLEAEDFNHLIECTLSGTDYYDILVKKT